MSCTAAIKPRLREAEIRSLEELNQYLGARYQEENADANASVLMACSCNGKLGGSIGLPGLPQESGGMFSACPPHSVLLVEGPGVARF
jgi:hypothetical protein